MLSFVFSTLFVLFKFFFFPSFRGFSVLILLFSVFVPNSYFNLHIQWQDRLSVLKFAFLSSVAELEHTKKNLNIPGGQGDERSNRDYTCGGKNCHIKSPSNGDAFSVSPP